MQGRTAAGIGAWMIGVTSASVLSLVAVAVFRQDSTTVQGPVLSQADVARDLSARSASTPGSPALTPSTTTTPDLGPSSAPAASPESATRARSTTPPSPPRAGTTTTAPATTPPTPSTAGTDSTPVSQAFDSAAGTVVVACPGTQVYLVSWSPAQGYQVAGALRGPSKIASVSLVGPRGTVTLRFWCNGGVPQTGGHGDDGTGDS